MFEFVSTAYNLKQTCARHIVNKSAVSRYNCKWIQWSSKRHLVRYGDIHINIKPHDRPTTLSEEIDVQIFEAVKSYFEANFHLIKYDLLDFVQHVLSAKYAFFWCSKICTILTQETHQSVDRELSELSKWHLSMNNERSRKRTRCSINNRCKWWAYWNCREAWKRYKISDHRLFFNIDETGIWSRLMVGKGARKVLKWSINRN